MVAPSTVVAEAARLQADVSAHKAAIRRHREQLSRAKAALVAFEEDLRRRGIALVLVPTTQRSGEGDIHGRPRSPARS